MSSKKIKFVNHDINFTHNKCEVNYNFKQCDYYIILNQIDYHHINFDKSKTIVLQGEPWIDENNNWGTHTWGYWKYPIDMLHVHNHKRFLNGYAFFTKYINSNKKCHKNNNYISTIQSYKYIDIGHIKRIDFIEFCVNKNIKFDIYGSNNSLMKYSSYKKPLDEKEQGFLNYKYYFMGENSYEYNYITEKLFEPILYECLTFYFGCPNVYDYLHPKSFVLLDQNDFEKSYQIIKTAIEQDWYAKYINYILIEKLRIKKLYSIEPTIELITNYYDLFHDIFKKFDCKYKIIFLDLNVDITKIYYIITQFVDHFDYIFYFTKYDIDKLNEKFIYINLDKYSSSNEFKYHLLYNLCKFQSKLEILYINDINYLSVDIIHKFISTSYNKKYDMIFSINNINNLFYTTSNYFIKCNITLPNELIFADDFLYNCNYLYI